MELHYNKNLKIVMEKIEQAIRRSLSPTMAGLWGNFLACLNYKIRGKVTFKFFPSSVLGLTLRACFLNPFQDNFTL